MRKFLIISCLCFALVFAFVPVFMPAVASAEQYVDTSIYDFNVNWNYAFLNYTNGVYNWNGAPQFNLMFTTISNYSLQKPYYAPSYFLEYYDLPLEFYFGRSVVSQFTYNVNAGYRFGTSAGAVSFVVDDYRTHTFFVVLSYFGQDSAEVSSSMANYMNQYTINGVTLSDIDYVTATICDEVWEVDDAQADTGYWVVYTDTFDDNYLFRMQFPTMAGGPLTSNTPHNDPFSTNNEFVVLKFEVTNGSYTFAGNGSSNGYVLGMFDVFQVSDEYGSGYDAGFNAGSSSGYDKGYTDAMNKYESMINSIKQNAYNDGYYAGLENAEQSTLFSMFTSIFDGLVTMITGLLDFNFMGYNILSLFKFIFTVGLVMLIFKIFNGGGSSE